MKWRGSEESKNVTDRRGMSGGGKAVLGGGVIGIVILLINLFGGESVQQLTPILEQFNQGSSTTTEETRTRTLTQQEVEMGQMVKVVFRYTEVTWSQIFKEHNKTYREPKMELFENNINTQCGAATADVGPFYCPADETVYMDLNFFKELHSRFGAKEGDFAIAYVIAHEVGHHIQTLLGTSNEVRKLQSKTDTKGANKLSVALELQADFYAGVWAKHNQKYLDAGDIEIALSAAQAVGDDAIQKRTQGQVTPDSFTHGTSAQRKEWFMKGYNTGDITQGDTFNALK
ncbi:neutral zinc metallopeptidase [Flavobacterium sp. NKUCC04_CG]|uniref:KPN_02809 family neutral zinc metallopeptidase n=1 Tax=Flavobacterium sp. NKUCC04_CG TaxID=2842121 RepID=UPI001C5BD00C|nr:neutral zinc metallopeptidase [Flavobacterium sp. NKUCC04_CG]MBW3519450.1 neutral zinc metallopeptidase [Flavobacterium sp. NKUCC04_CG]